MKKIDKLIILILAVLGVLFFLYGLNSNTAFVIAVSNTALKVADFGTSFWMIIAILLVILLFLLRYRNTEKSVKVEKYQ